MTDRPREGSSPFLVRLSMVAMIVCLEGALSASPADEGPSPDAYDVAWTSPSEDSSGSMPLGNGDVGLNAWVEPNGDVVFYISKTDAWGDNGRLLKVGRVRIHFDPTPLREEQPFKQTLRLQEGEMEIRYGKGGDATAVRLWVDANHPVVHLTAEGETPMTATAAIELWRTERYELPSIEVSDVLLDRSKPDRQHAPTIVEPDTVLTGQTDRIGWYHHNAKSVGPALTAKVQGLTGFERPDPLLHRTFGAVVTAQNGRRVDDLHLLSPKGSTHTFSIYVLTQHPATPAQWLAAIDQTIAATEKSPFEQRRKAHESWWTEFWDRSWIHVSSRQPAPAAAILPANDHRVKAGVDQNGGSRFRGTIGRISLFDRALSADELTKLARSAPDKPGPITEGLIGAWTQFPEPNLDTGGKDLTRSLTIEAWVKPATPPSGGRIVDKITPGRGDGFLLDTWPGNSLRYIAGRSVLTHKDCLTAGQWHHVAAVADGGQGFLRLYLDGRKVAEETTIGGDEAKVISRAYALQRFIDACAGRGRYPIKFNGSIFTVPYADKPGDADYRRWGPGYWWQNTRLPYLSMCASGDFEMMHPLFRMYADELLPLCRYRTRHYFGHDGAYYPECIYFWGDVFSETYGWTPFEQRQDKLQTSGWHKWEWVCGPELAWMMFDYYDYTQDEAFLKQKLLPTACEVLAFFDEHYQTGNDGQTGDDGKLVMHPSQALETWWDCTNPMPELAGLHALTARLLALPEDATTDAQRSFWRKLQKKLPDLPTREVDGVKMLAPAERFEQKRNIENPELYAVFPFRLIAVGRPDIELGIEALRHRWNRGHFGWRQDDIFMAYLGLAEEARNNLSARARRSHTGSRFPAFWGPNYDWVPDQDHGGVLMKALQSMVLQSDGDKIFLLPAWPDDWDVHFKLHAPKRTVVEMHYEGGRIRSLRITPDSRRKDVVTMNRPATSN